VYFSVFYFRTEGTEQLLWISMVPCRQCRLRPFVFTFRGLSTSFCTGNDAEETKKNCSGSVESWEPVNLSVSARWNSFKHSEIHAATENETRGTDQSINQSISIRLIRLRLGLVTYRGGIPA